MTRTVRKVLRVTFAASVFGALAFGAVEATAKPSAAAVGVCTYEFGKFCGDYCRANGYSGGGCYPYTNPVQCFCIP